MYYIFPIKETAPEAVIGIYEGDHKVEELSACVGTPCDFLSWIDVSMYKAEELRLKVERGEADLSCVCLSPRRPKHVGRHPLIHYTPSVGWINDPNGLVYDEDERKYHICFQHNPYGTKWGNMTWTHIETEDFIHYSEEKKLFRPCADGPAFSGTARKSERGLRYFYTAGTGNSAWSEDRGKRNIQKTALWNLRKEYPEEQRILNIPVESREARDPKIIYLADENCYLLILYCRENEFCIYSSEDLREWEQVQQITLPGMWECPDLFELKDQNGDGYHVFWSADGYYVVGHLEHKIFTPVSGVQSAYQCNQAGMTRYYAAQTFSNMENRILQIAWIQSEHCEGRCYTGELSLPVEITLRTDKEQYGLCFKPAGELERLRSVSRKFELTKIEPGFRIDRPEDRGVDRAEERALELEIIRAGGEGMIALEIGSTALQINFSTGEIRLGAKKFLCSEEEKFRIFADNDIIEIFSGRGKVYCTEKSNGCSVCVRKNTCSGGILEVFWLSPIEC